VAVFLWIRDFFILLKIRLPQNNQTPNGNHLPPFDQQEKIPNFLNLGKISMEE
jgi:hypothetical protein